MAETAIGPGIDQGMWRALVSSIADELFELSGNLIVRTIEVYVEGATSITVESTDRFPDAGRLSIGGVIAFYTSKTVRTFDGLTDKDGNAGIPDPKTEFTAVIDISRLNSQLDDLRAAFVVATAEGAELDAYARNHGLGRTRGTADLTFRALLREITYGEAQTIFLIEKILDVLFGVGTATVYEDAESFPHTVFIVFPASGSPTVFEGKTFLCGGEFQPQTGAFTVDVDNPVTKVYGVWDDTTTPKAWQPGPQGNRGPLLNLVDAILFPCSSSVLQPTQISSVGLFLPSDDGKAIYSGGTVWRVAFLDTNTLEVASDTYTDDGDLLLAGNTFTSTFKRFAPWMVGHTVEILSGVHAGAQRTIASYNSSLTVELSGGALAPANDMNWRLLPAFGTVPAFGIRLNRATVVGNTITTPQALPTEVVVDYTTIPSAHIMPSALFSGNDQYPFYLWDAGALIEAVLDLITAAGVRVVLIPE